MNQSNRTKVVIPVGIGNARRAREWCFDNVGMRDSLDPMEGRGLWDAVLSYNGKTQEFFLDDPVKAIELKLLFG